MNSKGIGNVTLRGNDTAVPGEGGPRSAMARNARVQTAGKGIPVPVRPAAERRLNANTRRHDGLGSERGLATPSPDAKGENLNPVFVDHAAGFLRHARTQL
jgi:hypothetical protein